MEPTVVSVVPNMITSALAPAFLISGIGAILNIIATRLGRAVDRRRELLAQVDEDSDFLRAELINIDRRVRLGRTAISLCVASALLVCVVIGLIFLNPLIRVNLSDAEGLTFIAAVLLLGCGLAVFLAEVRVAAQAPIALPRK